MTEKDKRIEELERKVEEMEERLAIMAEQCETIPDKTGAEPDVEGGGSNWYHVCGECHGVIYRAWNFCPECGKKVKWS